MTRSELIARVEALTGPDREVDAEIGSAFALSIREHNIDWTGRGRRTQVSFDPITNRRTKSNFTSSLDTTVSLIERRFPGWRHSYEKRTTGDCLAWVSDADDEPCIPAFGPTPAIALILALLRSLPEEER